MSENNGSSQTKVTPEQWASADWSLRNTELAKLLGVSRQRVEQKREALGKLPSGKQTRQQRQAILAEWARQNTERVRGWSWTRIRAAAPPGYGERSIRKALRAAGVTHRLCYFEALTEAAARRRSIQTPSGCWIWQGPTVYGQPSYLLRGSESRSQLVRRALWTVLHGAPGRTEVVRTSCGERMCVNPAHLVLVQNGSWQPKGMRVGKRAPEGTSISQAADRSGA